MTDNPWLPIDTMPLSTFGTSVDILDDRRIYSNVAVDRIATSRWSLLDEVWTGRPEYLQDFDRFHVNVDTREGDKLNLDRDAQWRPHV